MRTTININDRLLEAAKVHAAESHQTLTAVIEDALRLSLEPKPRAARTRQVAIPVSGSGGLMPGVDLDDDSALLDRMEGRT